MSTGNFSPDPRTALDVYINQEHTAPPPGWVDNAQDGKEQPTVWNYYSKKGETYDSDLVGDANNTSDVLLIFAGLFSAIVTAFISQTYPMLQPDPNDILASILQELQHPGSSAPAQSFSVPPYAVRVNCFLFAGLFTSMIVAFLSILIKQWARSYQRDLAGISSSHLRARIRHFRYHGARRWHFDDIVGLLSIFMHLALFISAIGIIDLLLSTARPVGYVALAVFLIGLAFFLITTVLPLLFLDAPFRSPLSKLLTGIKRSVARSRPRSRRRKEQKEEGLEDYLDQSQGGESEENGVVRTQLHLDLDILVHLLREADKSTERWILDLCFDKLPQLLLLEKKHPELFLRQKIIIEVYIFLAKGCVEVNKEGKEDEKEVKRTRLPRARKLCEFLSWYLSLPRSSEARDGLRQLLEANGFKPKELPILLAQDNNNTISVTRAASALGRLDHLQDPKGQPEDVCCIPCSIKFEKLEQTMKTDMVTAEKSRLVTAFLIQRSDCLTFYDKTGTINWSQRHSYFDKTHKSNKETTLRKVTEIQVGVLQKGLEECASVDNSRKIWDEAVKDRYGNASEELKKVWFYPLNKTLDGLPIRRIWRNAASAPSDLGSSSAHGTTRGIQGVSFNDSPSLTPAPMLDIPTSSS